MFRRFLIAVLIFLLAVLVAADRLGAIVAAHVLAGKVKTDEHLPSRPGTSIAGFPFLTQALSGKYNDVTIDANNVPVDGVVVTTLTAHLHGVHIPISHIANDSVQHVPVDRVDGTAFVAFVDINRYLSTHHRVGEQLSLQPATGATATVLDRARIRGKTISIRAVGSVSLSGNVIDVGVTHVLRAPGSTEALTPKVLQQVEKRLKITVPLNDLPFRIVLKSVAFTFAGVQVTGGAVNTVLGGHNVGN